MKDLIRSLSLKMILDFHEVLCFSKTNFLFTRNSLHLKNQFLISMKSCVPQKSFSIYIKVKVLPLLNTSVLLDISHSVEEITGFHSLFATNLYCVELEPFVCTSYLQALAFYSQGSNYRRSSIL